MWLNFRQPGSDAMFLSWPVVLIGVSIIIMFFPGPIFYYRSREWWAYSNVSTLALIKQSPRLKRSKVPSFTGRSLPGRVSRLFSW